MIRLMTPPELNVRRATVDDLARLVALWTDEGLPVATLEKRFQDFQVAATPDGEIRGAVALQVAGMDGFIHSEAFLHPEEADSVRDLLLRRLLIMTKNHGLYRAWTQLASPFWHRNGFQPPGDDLHPKPPAGLDQGGHPWLVLKLRDESTTPAISIEKEFALFREAEKLQTEKMYRQARMLKVLATVIALSVLLLILLSLGLFFVKTKLRKAGGEPREMPRLADRLHGTRLTAERPPSERWTLSVRR